MDRSWMVDCEYCPILRTSVTRVVSEKDKPDTVTKAEGGVDTDGRVRDVEIVAGLAVIPCGHAGNAVCLICCRSRMEYCVGYGKANA